MVTICKLMVTVVAPARERGLKCDKIDWLLDGKDVAPARERGLKSTWENGKDYSQLSLPRGSVD